MKQTKINILLIISEFIFYLLGVLSFINPFLINNNNGNVLRIPSGLLLSNLSALVSFDLVHDGMLESMTWYWALIFVFGLIPAIVMLIFGFLLRRRKKQVLNVGIALLIIDSLIFFTFLSNMQFIILNLIIRIAELVILILALRSIKS